MHEFEKKKNEDHYKKRDIFPYRDSETLKQLIYSPARVFIVYLPSDSFF